MTRFTNKTAIVTGAAHGIGRAIAHRLATEGAHVCLADIDITTATNVATTITDTTGTTTHAVPCDVTQRPSINNAITETVDVLGGIDILINNVGLGGDPNFTALTDTEWTRQTDPTLTGAIRCIQACIPHLLQSPGGGSVVSITSVNGMTGIGGVAYSAAKAGLISATTNLAIEYSPTTQNTINKPHGWIRFNAVAPGTIRTRVWEPANKQAIAQQLRHAYPMGRLGEPHDIAAAVAFLASHDASWITGVTLPVDGGLLTGPQTLLNHINQQ